MFTLLLALTLGGELDALLARGEVTLIESKADGHLHQVTNISDIDAPVEVVWAKLADFAAWPGWTPQIEETIVTPISATVFDVEWAIAVVGPAVRFKGRYTLNKPAWTITGVWVEGSLEGSRWTWRLEPRGPSQTRLYRTSFTNAVADNWVLRQVDDENHTLEYGINAASGLVEVKALKVAVER